MITVGLLQARSARLSRPFSGCWELRAELNGEGASAGAARARWGDVELVGELDPRRSGTFAGASVVTIVGGLRWRELLPPQPYANDNGVTAGAIARDLAATVGADIEVDGAVDRTLGRLWIRRHEAAGAALTRAFRTGCERPRWHIELDGRTLVRARQDQPVAASAYAVLQFDARDGMVDIEAELPLSIGPGAVLEASRLPERRRVLEVVLHADHRGQVLRARTEAA